MNRFAALLLLGLAVHPAVAQEAPATLSLEDAIALARENNPDYQARLNDEGVADWGVRAAYGSLLPSASVSGGLSYQGGGQARIGGYTTSDIGLGTTPAYYYSSYSVGVSLALSGADLYRLKQQRQSRAAVVAGLEAAGLTLESQVTQQYLAALRARDGVELAKAQLQRAEANQELADARYAAEAATVIEAKQAEVERGRAEVEVVRAQAAMETEKLRLLTLVGVDVDRDVRLTTDVKVFEPKWDVQTLISAALGGHPDLAAAKASLASANAGIGMAKSAYWPRLSLSTGLSGYTRRVGSDAYLLDQAEQSMVNARDQCALTNDILGRLSPPLPAQDCSQLRLTDEDRAQILDQNRQFPFNFASEPVSVSLGISLPIFQGLSRQQQLETAHAQAEDARLQVRSEELRVRSQVEIAYRTLQAAYKAEKLEQRNRSLADDQLKLAREQYRVGTTSFVDLMEAEALKANADRAYLLAVYSFQETLAALEAAVGQHLSIPEN